MSGFGYNVLGFGANASSAAAGPSDDQFNRVSFLSHFDGANNGVNNVFDDGSDSNHTITANGDVTQGSFGPFARPDGEWGVSFDNSGDSLSIPSSSDFGFGTGDYTISFMVFLTAINDYDTILAVGSGNNGLGLFIEDGVNLAFGRAGTAIDVTFSNVFTGLGRWNSIVFKRASGVVTVYVNGSSVGTNNTSSSQFDYQAAAISIGTETNGSTNPFGGIISNFRIVKGTALTPSSGFPTGKLTAVTNTKLLTCQSNRFVDNSASGHTITPTGNTAVTAFGPFLTSKVYDPAVNGASAYSDGSGDSLSTSSSADFALGTGDFTVEFWVYHLATPSATTYFDYRSASNQSTLYLWLYGDTGAIQLSIAGTTRAFTPPSLLNRWAHIAIARSSGTTKTFVDGTQYLSFSDSTNYIQGSTFYISRFYGSDSESVNGYICDFRWIKGTAVYTSAFTPPTAPLTAITNTKLLLNMADGQAIDSTAQDNIKLEGGAKLSTAQYKFGTSSILFDAEADNRASFKTKPFGTGDWTIEGFFRKVAEKGDNDAIWDTRGVGQSGTGYPTLIDETTPGQTRQMYYFGGSGGNHYLGSASALSLNTWYHIAVCRSGTSLRVFLDGTQVGDTDTDSTEYINDYFSLGGLGANYSLARGWDGYVDEFRISYMARYTSNFTVPDAAFPDKGQ